MEASSVDVQPVAPEPLVKELQKKYSEFKSLFSLPVCTVATNPPNPSLSELSDMMGQILLKIKPFFEKLQQPKFVVTDCNENEQMKMWYCVPTSMEIPKTLLFQQSAAQKLTESEKHLWHRMASFSDSEWYVVPILCMWLRNKGCEVDCCVVETKVLEVLPVLRMQTGTYKKNGQEYANTRDVLMSGFVEKSSGKRSALSVQFPAGRSRTPVVDLATVYACRGREDVWKKLCRNTGHRRAFVPFTMKKTTDGVDTDLQLFLLYNQLDPQMRKEFVEKVHEIVRTPGPPENPHKND